MLKLLILDTACPKPYTLKSLETDTLGGTEATCIRLCRELSKRFEVAVLQHNRAHTLVEDNITYLKNDQGKLDHQADVYITLRDPGTYANLVKSAPAAKHYLWMHDVLAGEYLEHTLKVLDGIPAHFIVGTVWQHSQLSQALGSKTQHNWKITILPNFVEAYCDRSYIGYDNYQLINFSSPHKGLLNVLRLFEKLRVVEPRFILKIANPGYFESVTEVPENVFNLGVMKHRELMSIVETSLCLFYPNTTFAETFGLVYAEANALGTPVIAHNIGAASEVLSTPSQIIDCNNDQLVIDTVIKWSKGERPVVKAREQYTINEAIREWVKFLNPMNRIK